MRTSDEIGRTTTNKTSNTEHGTTKSSNTSRDHQWKAQKGPPLKATNQNERKKAEKEESAVKRSVKMEA